ncbi:protoporphyrinogen/coproporphyrinogen oxidase [Microbacterium pygmaeum]|uniref:Protoporphyrinogen oxidase n=1 Tax=Microbacterium pygmaeum TaxID=370764 RepID=A0A1G7VPQ6_9MICO|nr:FAD-dependent oxidoreductase [Microbacterium pygmaeum]SDG61724.1 protoporphyrinogen oxidase [Microbacterium pygmaeum]
MTEPDTFDQLVAHAHETHVVVVGAGIAGLVAAYECAKVGMPVTVVEASDRLGGVIETIDLAGLRVDVGAQGYATHGGSVRSLVDDLGLGDRTRQTARRALWLSGLTGGPTPLPPGGVLGIPDNPWDERVRRIIGWRGAWRAYLDRLRPPLTIGQERSLGRLVRTRMGARVLDRLVAPAGIGAFAIHPDDVDVEIAAPGLSAALTRTGSLSGAVAQVRGEQTPDAGPGFEGVQGGMSVLIDALRDRLLELGAAIRTGEAVAALQRRGDGRWEVLTMRADASPAAPDDSPIEPAHTVILAGPESEARRLLSGVVPSLELAASAHADLDVVTLVIDSPELAAAPPRTEVYAIPGSSPATAVADLTAQWPDLARDAAGLRVLRVTFPGAAAAAAAETRPGPRDPGAQPPVSPPNPGLAGSGPDVGADDDTAASAATAVAVAAASALLGVPLEIGQVRATHRQRYAQPRPVSALGQAAAAAQARAAIGSVPGLAAVGAWLSGTGLAQVVPDAMEEAERVRRKALWNPAT